MPKISVFILAAIVQLAAGGPLAAAGVSSGVTAFVPLHTYFMAASGCSDSNPGTSAESPWCSPNHGSIVCGDVIVAAPGTYNTSYLQVYRTPSNCPSTSGGIDGAGGIYAAIILCDGGVGACNASGTANTRSFNFRASFWAVEGWQITNPGDGVAFAQDCLSNTLHHHLFFINNIAHDTGAGYSFGMCGGTGSWDYVAVVGSIAQHANMHSYCTSGFNFVVPKVLDTNPGTHVFAYSNYGIANTGNTRCGSDGNGLIVDSPDVTNYTQQIVVQNNIIFSSRQYGIHVFGQERSNVAPVVKVLQNTVYNSGTNPVGTTIGEITQNNIALTGAAKRNSADLYAFVSGVNSNATIGGLGNQNIFSGSATACDSGTGCDSERNVVAFGGRSYGTNIYIDPSFHNTTDLLNNREGVPNCRSFENVTQCMGYDASSETLANPSVIYDLTPTADGTSGKGFQLPSAACLSSFPDYPVWLKGLVYLHWTGSSVQRKTTLASVPCGL
jgi:hypothetical protein